MVKFLVFATATALVVLGALVQNAYGLDCKVCYVDYTKSEESANSCSVLPCNNKADLIKATAARFKSETGNAVSEADIAKVLDAQKVQPSKFMCSRSLTRNRGSRSILSSCTAALDGFPASDKPYKVKNYLKALMPETFTDAVLSFYHGKVFICDDKTGNGKNCGKDAEMKLPPPRVNLFYDKKG